MRVRELAAKLNDLSITSGTHMWKEGKDSLKLHPPPHTHLCLCARIKQTKHKNDTVFQLLFARDSAQCLTLIALCNAGPTDALANKLMHRDFSSNHTASNS